MTIEIEETNAEEVLDVEEEPEPRRDVDEVTLFHRICRPALAYPNEVWEQYLVDCGWVPYCTYHNGKVRVLHKWVDWRPSCPFQVDLIDPEAFSGSDRNRQLMYSFAGVCDAEEKLPAEIIAGLEITRCAMLAKQRQREYDERRSLQRKMKIADTSGKTLGLETKQDLRFPVVFDFETAAARDSFKLWWDQSGEADYASMVGIWTENEQADNVEELAMIDAAWNGDGQFIVRMSKAS